MTDPLKDIEHARQRRIQADARFAAELEAEARRALDLLRDERTMEHRFGAPAWRTSSDIAVRQQTIAGLERVLADGYCESLRADDPEGSAG